MRTTDNFVHIATAAGSLMLFATVNPAYSAGTERPTPTPTQRPSAPSKSDQVADLYARGKTAAEAGNYTEAMKLFDQANRLQPKNPDILNMLAYSQRKVGKLDEAFANYEKALKLRPRFPEAREYLGEAHLQAVLQEIETLKGYGIDGQPELDELVNALKDAAAGQQSSSQSRSW